MALRGVPVMFSTATLLGFTLGGQEFPSFPSHVYDTSSFPFFIFSQLKRDGVRVTRKITIYHDHREKGVFFLSLYHSCFVLN